MGNRHPLKAAMIGQIIGGGGWAGVRNLPDYRSEYCVAAPPHNFVSAASRQARRSSDAEN